MRYMHIVLHILGALPLVDIQPRRCGKHDSRIQKIHSRKSFIVFPDKFPFNMLIGILQRRIIR